MPTRLPALRLYYVTCFAALGAYFPFFPTWLEGRGITGFAMGTITATLPALGVFGPPAFGLIADAFGLRGVILRVACAGAFLSFSFIAIAGALGHPLGFVGLFTAILAFAFFRSPMVMMADVVALEQARSGGTTYARVRLWGSVGFVGSALVVGACVDPQRLVPLPVAITAGLFVALLAAWGLPVRAAVPPVPAPGHARALLARPEIRFFLATSFLATASHSSFDLCFSLHLRDLGAGHLAGFAWALGVFSEVVLMGYASRLFRRFDAPHLLAFAIAAASVRWAILACVHSVALVLVLQPLHAISFGLAWVSSLTYVKDAAPARSLATAQGLFMAASAAGSVTGMLVWGTLYRREGGAVTFASASLVGAMAFVTAVAWTRRAGSAPIAPVVPSMTASGADGVPR